MAKNPQMARPGAFSANFAPEVLNQFRGFCSSRGEKYTKVLEELAVFYINGGADIVQKMSVPEAGTDAAVPMTPPVTDKATEEHTKRINRLEESNEYVEETVNEILKRLDQIEKSIGSGGEKIKI